MNSIRKHPLFYDIKTKKWHVEPGTYTNTELSTIRWGAMSEPFPIHSSKAHTPSPKQIEWTVTTVKKKSHWLIGPLIGILTSPGKRNGSFSGSRRNFIDIMQTAQIEGGIVFVFTPESIRWENQYVRGSIFLPDIKKWVTLRFPLPNVVYNRIPYRTSEKQPLAQETIQRLHDTPGITLYNPHFFNKWDLVMKLRKSKQIAKHIPRTEVISDSAQLKQLLARYKQLYMKPVHGKAGNGIILLHSLANGQFRISAQHKQTTKRLHSKQFSPVWKIIQRRIAKRTHVIQQAIPLATWKGRPFDFRVLVQKERTGSWRVTGIGLRVASRNSITTHVPRGGSIATPKDVLPHVFSAAMSSAILRRIRLLSLRIAKELEKTYSPLGEMSLDIGIDKNGKLWFFEANSKPMKFDEPQIRRRSLRNIIHYARYLTFYRGETSNEYMDV